MVERSIVADEVAKELSPLLKKMGFKKKRLTWYKDTGDLTVVFNIQKSQWSNQEWYYNYGVAIHDLHKESIESINNCDLEARFVPATGKEDIANHICELVSYLEFWVHSYGTMSNLLEEARNQRLPLMTFARARAYLSARLASEQNYNNE